SCAACTEGLPRVFLQSLRTLFDILDDRRRGYVHLREIESRWRGAEARELPAGVMEGLRRAAPASGYLTFERFVLGLRAALPAAFACLPPCCSCLKARLGNKLSRKAGCREQGEVQQQGAEHAAGSAGDSAGDWDKEGGTAGSLPRHVWGGCWLHRRLPWRCTADRLTLSSVTGGDAKAAGQSQGDGSHPGSGDPKRHQRGRAEHRRHTITNGVDFSILKHMKELEQEKDFLLQGLELVERAREWYHQHIQFMQERQRLLGKNKTNADFLAESSQSQLGLLVPKLQEVNRCLGDLLSTASKPANPTSALSKLVPVASPASTGSQQAINMLKEQNRLLTKEVTDKSERITQLEQEKSALIKQLFEAHARNNHETNQLDSTFI
ncbi:SAPC2 protein, partial [Grus americana]|nr:SAPC2 protein [Grus americana]